MFKKLNSKLGLTFLIVLALLIVGIAYILYTSDSDDVKSARQNSEGRLVESDDVVIERAGNWTAQEAKSASSGSYLYSSGSPDDVLTLTFVGSRVEVLYTTGTNLGTLAVDVDHTVLRTIITADQATKYQERTVVDYLDDGLHTLRVYAQEGGVIGIDAFKVSHGREEPILVDRNKLGDQILAAAKTDDTICVEIVLQDPMSLSRTEFTQEKIAELQDQTVSSVKTGRFVDVTKFKHIPALGGHGDLTALLELQANPSVKRIDACMEAHQELSSSVPSIGADDVWNKYGIIPNSGV